jgi:hypothetical protein
MIIASLVTLLRSAHPIEFRLTSVTASICLCAAIYFKSIVTILRLWNSLSQNL